VNEESPKSSPGAYQKLHTRQWLLSAETVQDPRHSSEIYAWFARYNKTNISCKPLSVQFISRHYSPDLTFRNPASYIKDGHTATFNTPHFLHFFNKYTYCIFLTCCTLSISFSSKCRLFHNATFFGFCIIHILPTGCAKKLKNSGAKRLKVISHDKSFLLYYYYYYYYY
jgi:hypothetical protein